MNMNGIAIKINVQVHRGKHSITHPMASTVCQKNAKGIKKQRRLFSKVAYLIKGVRKMKPELHLHHHLRSHMEQMQYVAKNSL